MKPCKKLQQKNCFDSFYFILLFVLEVAGCKLFSEDLSASQTYVTQKKTTSHNEDKEGGLLSVRQNSERHVRTNLLWHVNRDNTFALCACILCGDTGGQPPTFNLINRGINGRQRQPKNCAICRHTPLSSPSTLGISWRSPKHSPTRLNCIAL